MIGQTIGSYRITAKLGEGGMGEVYRARDSKLDREVAIKVLPAALAQNADLMARFEREAKVLAALNHPNIAQIYGLEERAIVMELVEGPTLADRLKLGPLPLEESLTIARQVAEALEAAHEKGVIHRDLKPANIKAAPDAPVKVLDFGLATAVQGPERDSIDPANSPTLTMGGTEIGMILGTAAYMSPEQAAGKRVDKRADIWSFGVVLWEMLTGKRLFDGSETVSHTLADVLRSPIDFAKLPASTPTPICELLKRCLDRDLKTRLRDIGEARIAIQKYLANPTNAEESAPIPARSRTPWVVAAAAMAVALVLGFVSYRQMTEEAPRVLRVSVMPPDKVSLPANSIPAVSPDGRQVAFAGTFEGKTDLWVRDLSSLAARLLPGTEGASLPFWSPDSRSLGFFASGKLKKTDAVGGPALTLCDAQNGRGGTWNSNDVIVFAPGILSVLFRVPAAGGTPTPVSIISSPELGHRFPWFLPDGRHFLYNAVGSGRGENALYIGDLESKMRRALIPTPSNVVYSRGYLLFLKELTLMAQPFDASKLETTGDAAPIADQLSYNALDHRALFSSSQNGVLAYSSVGTSGDGQLTWFDRSGKAKGTLGAPGALNRPAISPDGTSVVVAHRDPQTGLYDLWLNNLVRDTSSRFTFNSANNDNPIWSPDNSRVAFYSTMKGPTYIYQKPIGGAGQEELLDGHIAALVTDDWSHDGRYVIEHTSAGAKNGNDLWVLPLFGDKKPFPYLQTSANEARAKLSPDGHWLAYVSDEINRNEIYVQTFPTAGGKSQISTNGGDYPVWSRDGKELYFIAADGKMMAVEVRIGANLEASAPKPLFDTHLAGSGFDVGKDGRFLIPTKIEQSSSAPMTIVVNWQASLKK